MAIQGHLYRPTNREVRALLMCSPKPQRIGSLPVPVASGREVFCSWCSLTEFSPNGTIRLPTYNSIDKKIEKKWMLHRKTRNNDPIHLHVELPEYPAYSQAVSPCLGQTYHIQPHLRGASAPGGKARAPLALLDRQHGIGLLQHCGHHLLIFI